MFLLRKVRKSRWERAVGGGAEAIAEAADDLSYRPQEEGLSVYEVTEGEAQTFAFHWCSVHQQTSDKPFDYLLISPDLIPEGALTATLDGAGDALLDERHREIKFEGTFTPDAFARSILRSDRKPVRIPKGELRAGVEQLRRRGP